MNVGWIGLGSVGTAMVTRALGAGHAVTAYARGVGQAEAAAAGAGFADDYRAVAESCDMLGVCVFSDVQLREAVIDSGALAALRPGAVLAVHTTGSPALAQELAERAPKGVGVLDACFSGARTDAMKGDLTLMVGGEADALERARPVLSTYAARIHLLGAAGSGQTLKLLNNLLFATNLKHAADIVQIAEAQGLDPKIAAKVIQESSGASWTMAMFERSSPEQILKGVRPYMVKDVKAAEAAAQSVGLNLSSFASILAFFR